MSEESKSERLIPLDDINTSEEQKELMLLLNQRVCALFEQKGDILLNPSPEMNNKKHWVHLKLIQANPQAHVGYWLGNRTCADNTGYVWLNVELTLWPMGEDGERKIVFLTPNQTHWVFDELKGNELLRRQLKTHTQSAIANLQTRLARLSELVDTGEFWNDEGKWNPVFDVATKDAKRRGWYTSQDIFMANVVPPPPWMYPYPNLQESWRIIREVGKRPIM